MTSLQIPDSIEDRLFINGEFVASVSGKKFDVINPATEKLSASIYEAGVEDVDKAVKAAQEAFPTWSELGADVRAGYLFKIADILEKNMLEATYLDAISMGMPIQGNFSNFMGIATLRYFAGRYMDICGDSSLNTAGMVNITFRQPFGVCAAIIPWNIPLLSAMIKVAPALITGNTLILKTSEKAPFSPMLFARAAKEVGLPPGVINILNGYGRPCGEAMAKHMHIRKLSFTGSVLVGRAIKKAAAESNLKNVTLELGGKSPLIVFEDADIEQASVLASQSILSNSGQNCIASSKVYVQEKIASKFVDAMKEKMNTMGVTGDPLLGKTLRGPQVDKVQFDKIMGFLNYAKEQNLAIFLGGEKDKDVGYFIQPTMIIDAPEDSKVMREEIFGPVVCVNTFNDESEVIKRANASEMGLYASIFTKDISRALRVAKKFESGQVAINCTSPTVALDMPFGGYKQSGDGREFSKYSTDHWTELKSIYIKL